MPMPRSETENQIYYDIVGVKSYSTYLDITEIFPKTNPRTWKFKDGSPATWFSWNAGEPNDSGNGEPYVAMLSRGGGDWNDAGGDGNYPQNVVCSYFLPAGAENNCPWLRDFQD